MTAPEARGDHDVIVIGAGLAGLTCALELARCGRRVLVLEERERAGGLCGTWGCGGYSFAVACNDFGSGVVDIVRRLGVPVRFRRTHTAFHLADAVVRIPVPFADLGTWLGRLPDMIRLLRAGRSGRHTTLGSLVRASVRDPRLADFVNGLGYPLGVAPRDVRLESMRAELSRELGYGYHRPCTPEGGPDALVQALATRLRELGGRLELGVRALDVEREGGRSFVRTREATLEARAVVSSQGRWDRSARFKPGLAVSMLLLGLRRTLPIPRDQHTLVSFPADVAGWMDALDAGTWPDAFGMHLFPNRSSDSEVRALSLYFFLPRGREDPTASESARAEAAVLERAERLLPGLTAAIAFRRFLSPRAFTETHGLSSRPSTRVLGPGFRKPDAYDPDTGVHHVGNSVQPPGEHAGQAVLSGVRAARRIERGLRAAG